MAVQPQIQGVGLNLRLELIDDILKTKPPVPFFEVIVDNWFSEGPHHAKLEKIRQDYDLLFHCVGMNLGGVDSLDQTYLDRVSELAARYQPHHISDHLCFQAHNGHHFHDLLPFPFNEEMQSHLCERIGVIQDFLKQPLVVENLSYYVEFTDSNQGEWEFIKQLLQHSGAQLLLDLNNIWVNAQNLEGSLEEWLPQIPWDAVAEVHVAGAEKRQDLIIDTHGADVHPDVFQLLRQYRERLQQVPVIYERDQNLPGLPKLLETCQQIQEVLHG